MKITDIEFSRNYLGNKTNQDLDELIIYNQKGEILASKQGRHNSRIELEYEGFNFVSFPIINTESFVDNEIYVTLTSIKNKIKENNQISIK